MAKRKYSNESEALEVAKEALWLAWNAAGSPSGMGWIQNKPDATKEDVWSNVMSMGDYPGARARADYVNADYVFGRMLKLRFHIKGNELDIPDHKPRWDYQGWCGEFKTYDALFDAAEQNIIKQMA